MSNQLLTKSFYSALAIAPYLLTKSSAGGAALASAATDALLGSSGAMGVQAGGMLDVMQVGFDEVTSGGVITDGDPLTSDAQGRAIKAVPGVGVITRIIGFARADANLGDIFHFQVAHGVIAKSA
jgi:hypothetical protein